MQDAQGKLRRNVDLRLVSYSISVLNDNAGNKELAVVARMLAASSLQLVGGFRALVETCKAASESEVLRKAMEPDKARRCSTMFEGLAESLEERRRGGLHELIELIVVFAGGCMRDDEDRRGLELWAKSLGIDTSPFAVDDDDEDLASVVELDDKVKKRVHKPRARPARTSYDRDRFEDLVREAVAVGVDSARPKLAGSRVEILGQHSRKGTVHLRWLRASMKEAEELTTRLNDELRKMRDTDPSRGSLSA